MKSYGPRRLLQINFIVMVFLLWIFSGCVNQRKITYDTKYCICKESKTLNDYNGIYTYVSPYGPQICIKCGKIITPIVGEKLISLSELRGYDLNK